MHERETSFPLKLPPLLVERAVAAALDEDLSLAGDITTDAIIPAEAQGEAAIVLRKAGVVAGLDLAEAAFKALDPQVRFKRIADDGGKVAAGGVVAEISGKTRALLTGERTALNFLGRLSGIATLTASYVAAVAGTKARIACTRKTTPGLRALEKYAVDAGGGINHRFGLYDAVLVKDNHIAAAGGRSPRRSSGCARGAAIWSRSRSRSTRCSSSRRRCAFPSTRCCSTIWMSRRCARR